MIIRELGEFSNIQSPAKCAARIGQTFSDTPITVKINPNIVSYESDVERNGRVFSDGVGTMSTSLMRKMWARLSKTSLAKPTCFQIRYAGMFKQKWIPNAALSTTSKFLKGTCHFRELSKLI